MAMMSQADAIQIVRDLIRENLPEGQTEGNWSDTQIVRYLKMGVEYAYPLECRHDKTRHKYSTTINGAGTELNSLPSKFRKLAELRDSATADDYYFAYKPISPDARDEWIRHTPTGKAYYFEGEQIGILPTLQTGETAYMKYYADCLIFGESAPAATSPPQALSYPGQMVAIYYAARICLADRADVNYATIDRELKVWEEKLPTIRKYNDAPTELVAYEGYTGPERNWRMIP